MKTHAKDWLASFGAEKLRRAYATFASGQFTREADQIVAAKLGPGAEVDGVTLTADTLAKARSVFGMSSRSAAKPPASPRPRPTLLDVLTAADRPQEAFAADGQAELPGMAHAEGSGSRAEWATFFLLKEVKSVLGEIKNILASNAGRAVLAQGKEQQADQQEAEPLRVVGGAGGGR
jgi:hypothetical protein